LTRETRGVAIRVVLIGILLSYPVWDPPLMRRIDPQAARRDVAIEAERTARASGELGKEPSGQIRRAVVYTPGDPADERGTNRSITWMFRLVALILVLQLFVRQRRVPEHQAAVADDG